MDEATAIPIAQRSVATNDTEFGTNVSYRARRDGPGWFVRAEVIVGTNDFGQPLTQVGGQRYIDIDERSGVTHYIRGH